MPNTASNTEVNYTPEMEAVLTDAAPLNLEKAKEIGEQIGRSYRSVIAKAKSLGLEYESLPPPKKRPIQTTKADLVAQISENLGADLGGLEKATMCALDNLAQAVSGILDEVDCFESTESETETVAAE